MEPNTEYVQELARRVYANELALRAAGSLPTRTPPATPERWPGLNALPRRTYARVVPWRFTSLLKAAADRAHGYRPVGRAVGRELRALAPRVVRDTEVLRDLDAAITALDARAVMRWTVLHMPVIARYIPRRRRYARSFLDGLVDGLRDHGRSPRGNLPTSEKRQVA
jgi:hypothetical protein